MSPSAPLRVAIVGAGPSGLFAADALLKARDDVRVDVFDRLPTPYGLVRYGVAPDHAKIKAVTRTFETTCRDPRVRFFGNVDVGHEVSLDELRRRSHAVVLAVGASSDRALGIPGEELAGSLSATEFVAWYNGHPEYVDLEPYLDAKHAVVVGMGNVAVDVARILAKSVDELRTTDIADHALEALAGSEVQEITMLGRRGPAQAKWTTKELRELGELENADIDIDASELALDPASATAIATDRPMLKNMELLRSFASLTPSGKPRTLHVRFFASPIELRGRDGRVEEMVIGINRLEERDGGYLAAVDTGERETLPADVVYRSVGYRGVPFEGAPFDERRGVIPHEEGRVVDASGERIPGTYVAGWIKRGPSGVIGTNKADAMKTVDMLLADATADVLPEPDLPDDDAIPTLLADHGVRYVDFDGWLRLDAREMKDGASSGRPRVKVVTVDEMLEAASEST